MLKNESQIYLSNCEKKSDLLVLSQPYDPF